MLGKFYLTRRHRGRGGRRRWAERQLKRKMLAIPFANESKGRVISGAMSRRVFHRMMRGSRMTKKKILKIVFMMAIRFLIGESRSDLQRCGFRGGKYFVRFR